MLIHRRKLRARDCTSFMTSVVNVAHDSGQQYQYETTAAADADDNDSVYRHVWLAVRCRQIAFE